MGRILSLSDGIFAFAMTLLVLNLTVPTRGLSGAELSNYLLGANLRASFFAYLVGFLIIGSFWVGHHRLFRHIRRWDTVLLWLNMFLLVTVAVEPFVIGVYMSEGPSFPTVVVVATSWAASGGLLAAIWVYASRGRRLVGRSLSQAYVRRYAENLAVTPILFALSIPVALLNASAAEFVWLGGVVAQALFRRKFTKHRAHDVSGPSNETRENDGAGPSA